MADAPLPIGVTNRYRSLSTRPICSAIRDIATRREYLPIRAVWRRIENHRRTDCAAAPRWSYPDGVAEKPGLSNTGLNNPIVRRLAIPVLLLGGAVALFAAVQVAGQNEPIPVDQVIEALIPAPSDEVLSQVDVGIDLATGFAAELTINGVEIPESQMRIIEALNEYTFRPDQGKVITSLRADQNCVVARYWPIAQGRVAARSTSWCFTAS